MLDQVHFISGLPRSGSTLLAAILRQNPAFEAGITSPVAPICAAVHQKIAGASEFAMHFDERRCAQMLRGIFETYYADVDRSRVVFDTNRDWTAYTPLLGTLYPNCRIICCVREIGWVLDSIERVRTRHPLKISKLFSNQGTDSIYARVDALMNAEHGLVGRAWSTLREAWFSETAKRLIVIPYDALVREPVRTLRRLYRELDQPYFEHNLRNVEFESTQYDSQLGAPGLHSVHRVVEHRARDPIIPPDLFTKYSRSHFWDNPELNTRGVTVL